MEKEGEEPKSVSSCHHPELSSASEPRLEKNTSLFLTYSSPLSVSQHQSAHLGWMQKRQDDSHESAGYALTSEPNFKCSLALHKEKLSLLSFMKLNKKSLPATITHNTIVFLEITSLDLFLCLPHLPPLPFTQCLLSDQHIPV